MKQKDEVRVDGKPVFYAVLYESFRKAALECGYALGLHGSMQRDMDLMAMAWVENPKPIEVLVEKINECIGETVWKEENLKLKEVRFGRHIYTLSIMGDWHLDLSIIPKPEAAGVQELKPTIKDILDEYDFIEFENRKYYHRSIVINAMAEYATLPQPDSCQQCEYWKARCEAAERLILDDARIAKWRDYENWQLLKQTRIKNNNTY